MKIFLFSSLAFSLTLACSSSSSGSAGDAGDGGINSDGGYDGGAPDASCLNLICTSDSDCCGLKCGVQGQGCCEVEGTECTQDSDCCSSFCNGEISQCGVSPFINPDGGTDGGTTLGTSIGTTSGGATSTGTVSSGTSGGGTTTGGTSSGGTSTGGGTTGASSTGGSVSSSVVFGWVFNGNQTCEAAGADWVQTDLAGTTATVPCRGSDGAAAASVSTSLQGDQSWSLTGYTTVGQQTLYQASGVVEIDGGVTVNANLNLPSPLPGSALDLAWTFGGRSCTQAGVSSVSIDLLPPQNLQETVPCAGDGGEGSSLPGWGAGHYPFEIQGLSIDGGVLFRTQGIATLNGASAAEMLLDLAPPAPDGGVALLLANLSFGGQSCLSAGIDTLDVSLRNAQGVAAAGQSVSTPCVDASSSVVTSHLFTGVSSGSYWLELLGLQAGATLDLAVVQVTVPSTGTATFAVDAKPPP